MIENNRLQINEIKTMIPAQKVIVIRNISKEEATKEILRLFSEKGTLYYSDIAYELSLNLKTVVDICEELQNSGKIGIDDRTT